MRQHLTQAEGCLWTACVASLDEEGYVKPTHTDLARQLGMDRRYISALIVRLRAKGYLRRVGHWDQVLCAQ